MIELPREISSSAIKFLIAKTDRERQKLTEVTSKNEDNLKKDTVNTLIQDHILIQDPLLHQRHNLVVLGG